MVARHNDLIQDVSAGNHPSSFNNRANPRTPIRFKSQGHSTRRFSLSFTKTAVRVPSQHNEVLAYTYRYVAAGTFFPTPRRAPQHATVDVTSYTRNHLHEYTPTRSLISHASPSVALPSTVGDDYETRLARSMFYRFKQTIHTLLQHNTMHIQYMIKIGV
jgi:hypothetical protein